MGVAYEVAIEEIADRLATLGLATKSDQAAKRIERIVSVIDNLVKGAAGQAVQNMNLMLGFREQEALL